MVQNVGMNSNKKALAYRVESMRMIIQKPKFKNIKNKNKKLKVFGTQIFSLKWVIFRIQYIYGSRFCSWNSIANYQFPLVIRALYFFEHQLGTFYHMKKCINDC